MRGLDARDEEKKDSGDNYYVPIPHHILTLVCMSSVLIVTYNIFFFKINALYYFLGGNDAIHVLMDANQTAHLERHSQITFTRTK